MAMVLAPFMFMIMYIMMIQMLLRILPQLMVSLATNIQLNVKTELDTAEIHIKGSSSNPIYVAIGCTKGELFIPTYGDRVPAGEARMYVFGTSIDTTIMVTTVTSEAEGYVEVGICLDRECKQRTMIDKRTFVLHSVLGDITPYPLPGGIRWAL